MRQHHASRSRPTTFAGAFALAVACCLAAGCLSPLAPGVAVAPAAPFEPGAALLDLASSVPEASRPTLAQANDAVTASVAAARAIGDPASIEDLVRQAMRLDGAGRFGDPDVAGVPAYGSMSEALAALAAAAGVDAPAADLARLPAVAAALPADLQEAVIDLAAHTVRALELQRQAFSAMPAADAALLHGLPALLRGLDAARLQELAKAPPSDGDAFLEALGVDEAAFHAASAEVDWHAFGAAAVVAAQGVDHAIALLRPLQGMPRPAALDAVPTGTRLAPFGGPPLFGPCALLPGAFLAVSGILYLGFGGAESYGAGAGTDVLLSIDLGGDDAYCNNSGSTQASGGDPLNGFATCAPVLPIGIAIDLGGDDAYHSTYKGVNTDDTSGSSIECFEGSGMNGIGILADLSGDDAYNSGKVLSDTPGGPGTPCPTATAFGGGPALFIEGSIGTGLTGVGVLADFGGDDAYNSYNTLCGVEAGTVINMVVTEGAAVSGLGVAFDTGASRNAWSSSNAQTSWVPGGGNGNFALHEQGTGDDAVGALVSKEGVDRYGSDNTQSLPFGGTNVFSVFEAQGHGDPAGIGLFADLSGDDTHFCHNQQSGTNPAALVSTAVLSLLDHQGVGRFGSGALVDLDGNDCYDSLNDQTSDIVELHDEVAQGVGIAGLSTSTARASVGGVGVFVDEGGRQDFISANTLAGTFPNAFGPGGVKYTTWLDVQRVEGAADGEGAIGVMAVANAGNGDRYASGNAQSSTSFLDAANVVCSQGSGGGVTGPGILLDVDTGSPDSYNSLNVANAGAGSADGIVIDSVQGAGCPQGLGITTAAALRTDATSLFVDALGPNNYNVGDVYAPFAGFGACLIPTYPMSAGASCIDWSNGESAGLLLGAFVDLSVLPGFPAVGPDAYAPPFWSYGRGMYGSAGTFSVCLDAGDAPFDVPAPCREV